jgi:hypothetical protein
MSETARLGAADAQNRWIGVRRHQAVVVIIGLGLIGRWVTAANSSVVEVVVGVVLVICAVPTNDALTVGERVRIGVDYLVRSRWTSVRVKVESGELLIEAHGIATIRGFELQHRGRLDLSGRDAEGANALANFVDALAVADVTQHVSLHVVSRPDAVSTLLALPIGASAPSQWHENVALAVATVDGHGAALLLERWSYLRSAHELIRVLRIRDYSAVPDSHHLLEQIQFASASLDVSVHIDVLAGARAQRLASRAVHRAGSDDATSQAAGFRRTAQSSRSNDRLRQREMSVVEGAALLRVAVFLVVRSGSLHVLDSAVRTLTRSAGEAGLRCESGRGRQALWYCAQLPGGPGW